MAKMNLWPVEITQEIGVVGPAAILREQASQLGQQTKNLVKAYVSGVRQEEDFVDYFVIEGPIINYRYHLFTASYPIDFYPATINSDSSGTTYFAQNEEEFVECLQTIFSSPKTIKIIQAIIIRSKQEKPRQETIDDDFDDSDPFADE
ncbi:hypothetical protein IAD21_01248 [Abditibacteriota bacterium]|nr:hypothetical protein IAD21_01248 [Abditibacteriota bacterium]